MNDLAIPFEPLQSVSLPGSSFSAPNFLTSSWDSIESWFGGKNADTAGMTPSMTKTAQTGQAMRNLGLFTAIVGGIGSAFGAYYSAKAAQYQQKSQASAFAFQSDMASINSSRAEKTAESILEAGKSQVANYTMQAGQRRAGAIAAIGARGIALGPGSAAEVIASMDIEKDINVLNINSNTTRQAWAAREQGTDYQNEALLDRVSSVNAKRSADSISPTSAAVTSLIGTATQVAGEWDWNRWMKQRMAAGSPVPQIGIGGS